MTNNADFSLLIVENDPTCLEMCRNIITMQFPKMIVHTAKNTEEAINEYKVHKDEIVLTDIFDQSKYGITIAREICEINPGAFVIFITADNNITWESLKYNAERLPLKGLLYKPIDINEVINTIKEAVSILNTMSKHNCQQMSPQN